MRAAAPLTGAAPPRAAPLIGILYLAAIIEPALSYRPSHPIIRRTRFSNSLVSLRDEHVRKLSVAGELRVRERRRTGHAAKMRYADLLERLTLRLAFSSPWS